MEIWHTYRIIERYTPKLASFMHSARQQNGENVLYRDQLAAIPAGTHRNGAAARHRPAWLPQEESPMWPSWPPLVPWHSSRTPSSVASCPTRTIAMAQGWFGLPFSPSPSRSCVLRADLDHAATSPKLRPRNGSQSRRPWGSFARIIANCAAGISADLRHRTRISCRAHDGCSHKGPRSQGKAARGDQPRQLGARADRPHHR